MASEFEKQRALAFDQVFARRVENCNYTVAAQELQREDWNEAANWSRRYMLESDPVIKGLVEALRDENNHVHHPDDDEWKLRCNACQALAAFAQSVDQEGTKT